MTFECVATYPVWLRWMSCSYCGAFTAVDVKGGHRLTVNSLPTGQRIGNDPEYRVESVRPDDIRSVPSVQQKRVGGPIGRYQL